MKKVFTDKASGKLARRPELDKALLVARAGDQLVVTKLDPYTPLRRALAGTSRGLQFSFEDSEREQLQEGGTVMLPLWQRGDTLEQSLAVLHGIAEDPSAGRAERDDMIEAFTGLDRHIPRQVRSNLVSWQNEGYITISQVPLPDAPEDTDLLADPHMQWLFRRWSADSPLRRAAFAGLAYLQTLGADFDRLELAGNRMPTVLHRAGHREDARWWVNWKWQRHRAIPFHVTRGSAWLEVVQPTRTRPLDALLIQPGPNAAAFRD